MSARYHKCDGWNKCARTNFAGDRIVTAIMHADATKRAGVKAVSGGVLAGEISRVRQVKSMRMLKR